MYFYTLRKEFREMNITKKKMLVRIANNRTWLALALTQQQQMRPGKRGKR